MDINKAQNKVIIMYPLEKFKDEVTKAVSYYAGLKKEEVVLEKPPEGIDADIAFPCFALAKRDRKNPAEIAKALEGKVSYPDIIERIEARGPYLNFYANWKKLSHEILSQIISRKEEYGRHPKRKERVMVEYAHPNTHKAFHIGHVRNICTGESLCRILEADGVTVMRANYQGDIGPHVAKCLWGLKKGIGGKEPQKDKGKWLGTVYSKASMKIAEDEKLKEEAGRINEDLYAGKKEMVGLWEKTRKWSLDYFSGIYRDFGARFDRLYFESEVEKRGKEIVLDMLRRGIAKESKGAIVMDLEKYGLGTFVLLTGRGTPLYHTKDLALAELQMKEHKPDRIIHVVGAEQSMYFRQLFKMLESVMPVVAEREFHLSYQLVNLTTGKMKSREGQVILYDDLKQKLSELALQEARKKNPKISAKVAEGIAGIVALGALKYGMLNVSPEKLIIFDWERALELHGNTGPYLQYTHTRMNSILQKTRLVHEFDAYVLAEAKEKELIKALAGFPEAVAEAARDLRPHYIVHYAHGLATLFNEFYETHRVIDAEHPVKEARVALVKAAQITLKNSLHLLGIDTPERM